MVFNVISWECIAGSALVLFARHIEMPPSWVGKLLSFMPLSQIIVVFMVPVVTRLGSKRLMYNTWMFRNLTACCVFIMPWAMQWWGPTAAWYVLLTSTLGFCIARSVGAGGWFPWLHEVVPEHQRGLYFSAEASVARLVVLCVAIGQGIILWGNGGLNRYLIIYAIGISSGLFSLVWMKRVPGGDGNPEATFAQGRLAAFSIALKDRRFFRFVLTASFCVSCFSWLGSSMTMYMRDQLGMADLHIMMLVGLGSGGVLFTISSWMRFAEHHGSGHTMFLTLAGHSVIGMVLFALLPGQAWTTYAIVPVYVLLNVLGAAYWVSMNRAMLNCINPENRVTYGSLWTVCTSLSGGATPILAGYIIEWMDLWGFRMCFGIAVVGGALGAVLCRHVVRDGGAQGWDWRRSLTVGAPVRGLTRIVKVTVGLDETNVTR